MTRVSLIKGDDRYENIITALKEIKDEIKKKIKGKKKIVIKPNFVSTTRQLAATHVDTVKAVLDFLKPLTSEKITIAESAALGTAKDGYKKFNYYQLQNNYNVDLIDLNDDQTREIEIYDHDLKPLKIKVSKMILESDYLISLAIPKTHDTVVVTLSLKNIAMGWIPGGVAEKAKVSHSYKAFNLSLAKMIEIKKPDLAVIDGFESMEGDGPVHGEPVPTRYCLASIDPVSADAVATYLMGFDIDKVGYLHYCKERGLGEGDLKKIQIVGNASLEKLKRKFKPHPQYQEELNWR